MKTLNHRRSIITAEWASAGAWKASFFRQRFGLALAGLAFAAIGVSSLPAGSIGPGQPVPVTRVVIQFTPPGNFELQSQHPLTKVLTPSDPLPEMPLSGFWFELQSAAGEVKYRRIIGNPVFPIGDPGRGPLERVFPLLIPRPVTGDQLVLFSSPMTPEGQSQAAQPVARLDLVPIGIN